MIVNLIRNADYPLEKFKDVLEILGKSQKRIKFKTLSDAEVPLNSNDSVDRRILFNSCNDVRRRHSIPAEEFVVFITTVKNNDNWFSRYDKKNNVFIYGPEWDNMKNLSIYPVAYEVMANVLQSLMKLSLEPLDRLVHRDPTGCMNDFCVNKTHILLKLRTGDICEGCIKELDRKKVSPLLIDQAIEVFEQIRVQLLYRQGWKSKVSSIRFTRNSIELVDFGNYALDDNRLTPVRRAMFLFFLLHPEGVHRQQLRNYRQQFFDLYQCFMTTNIDENIASTVNSFIEDKNWFDSNLSHLNSAIKASIGKRIAKEYVINKTDQGYRALLSPDLVIQEIEWVAY